MDNERRFWIVQQVPDTKCTSGVNPLFKIMKCSKETYTLISDGAPNFYQAFNKEFWTTKNRRAATAVILE